MFGTMTLYLRNALLNMLLRGENFVIPIGSFVQLWNGSPILNTSAAVGSAEEAVWTISSVGKTSNSNTITFTNGSGSTWNVSHIAILDDDANILFYAPLKGGRNILDQESMVLEPGMITVTLD